MQKSPLRPHSSASGLSMFLFGAAYYPEHDTEKDLADDLDRLTAARVNVVRMAEFAWDRMEPREGIFDFEFFDRHIARLGGAGVKTILCTPTASPPKWLTKKYPEVLRVDRDGKPLMHGSRQHASHCSTVFRELSRAITRAMAEHYADNPHVIGWQTDNEFHCHFSEDYSAAARDGFQKFLREKYGKISALNDAWGTSFWTSTYDDFEDVDPPYAGRPTYENPGHRLDYLRYLSVAVIAFQRDQVDILRAANPAWWIMHNGVFENIDYREFARDLDFMGVDVYPMFIDPSTRAEWTARVLARTRSFSGNFIVPELQSGPGGQGIYLHDRPEPGWMRLFAWQCAAHGADGILHFRWRSCRFGAEEYWEGVIDHDNRLRARYEEFAREGVEFQRLGPKLLGTTLKPEVGFLFDTGTAEMSHQPLTHSLPSPVKVADVLFSEWWRSGYGVGYVHPLDDLSCFKLLFLPCFTIVTTEEAAALTAWVKAGGALVILARSGRKDEFSRVLAETPPGPLAALAGCEVAEYSRVNQTNPPADQPYSFLWAGQVCVEHLWREVLETKEGEPVAFWQTGRLAGTPAVVKNAVGKGWCLYVGTYPDSALAHSWIAPLAEISGVRPLVPEVPEGVEVTLRSGVNGRFLFVLNHSQETKTVKNLPAGYDLIDESEVRNGELELEPSGVAVLELPR